MAVRPIVRAGHPALRRPAAPVPDPTDPAVRALVDDMLDSLSEAGGIGLAAPQIAVPLRVVIFSVPAARVGGGGEDVPRPMTVLVNPVITPLGDTLVEGWEACLSLPGLRGLVPRFERIRYAGWDLDGAPVEAVASGFHARVVQHECDHLDGRLYPSRMTDLGKLGFTDELARAELDQGGAEQEDADGS